MMDYYMTCYEMIVYYMIGQNMANVIGYEITR